MSELYTPAAVAPPQAADANGAGLGLTDSIYNRLLKERIIWLGSEVRDDNANAICAQMLLLAAEDPERDIYLYINSPGGSVTAGSPGKRLALPNARVLIHQPAMEGMQGQASDIEIVANEIDRMRSWLEDTLASHTGQDQEKIHADLERDKILTAEAAKDYGIVDQVLTSRKAPASPHSS